MWLSDKIEKDFLDKIPKITDYKKNGLNPYEKEEINMAKKLGIQAEKLLTSIKNPKLKRIFKEELITRLSIAFNDGLSPTEFWELSDWIKQIENKLNAINKYELSMEIKDKVEKLVQKRFKKELSLLKQEVINSPQIPTEKILIKSLYQAIKTKPIKPTDTEKSYFFSKKHWVVNGTIDTNLFDKAIDLLGDRNTPTIEFKLIPSNKFGDILIYKNTIYFPKENKIFTNIKNLNITENNNFVRLSFEKNEKIYIYYLLNINQKEYFFWFSLNSKYYYNLTRNIKDKIKLENFDVHLYGELLNKKSSISNKQEKKTIFKKVEKDKPYISNLKLSRLEYKKRMKIIKETLEKDSEIKKAINCVLDNITGTTIYINHKKITFTKKFIKKNYNTLRENLIQLILFIVDIESKGDPLAKNKEGSSARWLWQWLTKNWHREYHNWKKIWKTSSWETTLNEIWLSYKKNNLPKIKNFQWKFITHPLQLTPTKLNWKDQLKILILSLGKKNNKFKEYVATALTWNIWAIEQIYKKFHHTHPNKATKKLIKAIAKNFYWRLNLLDS